jgi:hypothetical protein
MTDDALTKTPDPTTQAEVIVEPPAPELPEGKTLRAYAFYNPTPRCSDCHSPLHVRVFDGQPPKGHDDNIRYQEIIVLGVGHCPRCQIRVVEAIKGVS